jgi:hypothetical protein
MSSRLQSALSVTALVVAVLGWTPLGEATRNAVFPANSVGTDQLRVNAVVSSKVRNGSVTGLDIQKRTITNAHIKPASLLAGSFKAGQLPAGAKGEKGDKGDKGEKGEKGDKGAKGDPGLSGYEVVQGALVTLPPNGTAIARVTCPAGKRPIGGGGHHSSAVGFVAALSSSIPIDGNQWQGAFKNLTANSASIRAHAVCATVTP